MGEGIYKVNVFKRLESVKESNISEINKRLIQEFVNNCIVTGLGEHRILKYISTLKMIAQSMQLDFDAADTKDLQSYVAILEQSDASEWTKHDYKVTLKKFYKWHLDEENPVITKWIKTRISNSKSKLPDDIINEHEVTQLILTATNKRDKAFIALLWDIGARIGEIGTLRIKHVIFDNQGAVINLNGKTGPRRVRAVFSVSYIKEWIEEHPAKNNPNAPLWIKFNNGTQLTMLRYEAIRMQLIKVSNKAGINKNLHPHLFRHSRATYMANFLTEAQMNAYFGWVQGSDMPAVYVHLSGRDIDDAVLKANGIMKSENEPEKIDTDNSDLVCDMDNNILDALVEEKLKKMMMKLLV
jgi:site-specific recombinase XerD